MVIRGTGDTVSGPMPMEVKIPPFCSKTPEHSLDLASFIKSSGVCSVHFGFVNLRSWVTLGSPPDITVVVKICAEGLSTAFHKW